MVLLFIVRLSFLFIKLVVVEKLSSTLQSPLIPLAVRFCCCFVVLLVGQMGKLAFARELLGFFCFSTGSKSSCVYLSSLGTQESMEKKTLVNSEGSQVERFGDLVGGDQTLVFKLKPKMVVLRVSMHCNGCVRKVEKHISKMEGVTSIKVDLDRKKVTVMGNISPFEVLERVSKVKIAEIWTPI